MKTSNNSIKAIIFTIILFLFILFISLFKGINLYNIKTQNVSIKHVSIKINHKIVLKLNDINIISSNKYTKEVLKLHKILLTFIKALKIFEVIEIKNLNYEKLHISTILLKNKNITLNSNYIKLKGVINPEIKNSYVNLNFITLPEYNLTLNNVVINLLFSKNYIKTNGQMFFHHKKIDFSGEMNKQNILKLSAFANEIDNYVFQNIKIPQLKNLSISSQINLNNFKFKIYAYTDLANLIYNKIFIKSYFTNAQIFNNKIKITASQIFIPYVKNIKNLFLSRVNLTYNPNYLFLNVFTNKLLGQYKQYKFALDKNSLIFISPKNFNFENKKIEIEYKGYKIIFSKNLLNVFNRYNFYSINNGKLTGKNINLKTSSILGNFEKLFTKQIQGQLFKYKLQAKNINVNIKHKTAAIKKLSYNNIPLKNIKFKNNAITFTSDSYLNQNIKQLLKSFLNINLPLIQLGGENKIFTKIIIKPFNFITNIKLYLGLFKLVNLDLFIKKADIDITPKNLHFKTDKASLYIAKNMPLIFKGSGNVDFNKKIMSMDGNISFKINNILNLKNYAENIIYNLSKNTIYAINSSVYIDLNTNALIINPLKYIIKYTEFKNFISNGILYIDFNKIIKVISYLKLKLPIFYRHSNKAITKKTKKPIMTTSLFINIDKNTTNIYNNFVNIKIEKNNFNIKLENIDIDLYPIEKKLLLNKKTENNTSSEIKNSFKGKINLYSSNTNLIYKNYKFLSQKAHIVYTNKKFEFKSYYKNSSIYGYSKQQYILLEGKHFSNTELKAFLPNLNFFRSIDVDFTLVKSPDDFLTGKIYINKATVKELKTLNNVIAFINTIPSLLSLSSPGYSAKGYKIKKGFISYLLYKNILYIKQAKIYGDNLDFFAKGYINLNKKTIFLKITANMKMKLKKIPIVGKGLSYLLFGKDGSIDIKLVVKGNLNNPKVKKDIGKDILLSPFKLFKRAITLPFNLF